ncbi:AmmeMemoRadiSam system protein B [Vibrio hannami]|uniref:AmmeMemoRadiSam system protein B n=1 Tax=Vibrio hannami TaxID=2717094 RepID=UPI00240F3444|nr:AmmeMemoRadiSam system protein B [Vibrio hannami]MDG3087894.1 AmmeMemoRadiSam system protein B [Vibrio hannami]
MTTRYPAVAGRFYDDSAQDLKSQIEQWLDEATLSPEQSNNLKALIVPHAGYIYSGSTAAKAYKQLSQISDKIKRVVLIGPSHYYSFDGCVIPEADIFTSPLGEITLDTDGMNLLLNSEHVTASDEAHSPEHCLEVQLPFLQTSLNDIKLLPILTGYITPEVLASLLEPLWQDEQTIFVISSDLSHFHPYSNAQDIDKESCSHIESLQPDLTPEMACGCTAINTLLVLAQKSGCSLHKLELINSGDTAGNKSRVVGYVSYTVTSP